MDEKMKNTSFTMPLYAIMREKPNLLEIMLQKGASLDFDVNRNHVQALLLMKDP